MSMVARVSSLSWDNLYQLVTITPGDVLEITAMVGKEVEELALFLEERFPGIVAELEKRYLKLVLDMMPVGSVPTKEEVDALAEPLLSAGEDLQVVRDAVVDRFYSVVNVGSPNYAKRAMIALIDSVLGDKVGALHSAGFAQCNFEDPNFDEQMTNGDKQGPIPTLLNSERKKAEVLIQIIAERR